MVRIWKISNEPGKFLFMCPGCEMHHWFKTSGPGPVWTFNMDMQNPTVRASILTSYTKKLTEEQYQRAMKGETVETERMVCHSYITDGKIQFLSDCTHPLKNQTVELPYQED